MKRRTALVAPLRSACALWLGWAGFGLRLGHAQPAQAVPDYQIKAAYLYKFLGFVEWPPQVFDSPDSPFVIGVFGADALAEELAQVVAHRQAGGRSAVTRNLHGGESITGLHLLFIGQVAAARAQGLLTQARKLPLLTVTESDEAFAAACAIKFVVVDNKVRFDVALNNAEANNLKISSRLLGVARHVTGAGSQGSEGPLPGFLDPVGPPDAKRQPGGRA